MVEVSSDILEGHAMAKKALAHAYAPYSNFKVGCALKVFGDDRIHIGCNVENVVSPSGICAERAAISALFGEKDPSLIKLRWIVVVSDSTLGDVPCGMCQQVLAEFSDPDLPIYIGNLQELKACHSLRDLRPLNYVFPHRKDQLDS
ncbi:MAG: cytidine deaminase [Bacteriovoracales bacterium]|nr:cytidine deaminase [Bacteriovoracales bacterium]